ncbi:MAG: hypothetical protein H5T93_02305 [Pseudothermotoga sp.]|uniref:hypothetical protein n=1 Tax=Pseudothermotoga sp. TaxID=2033661 RepID=UPI000AF1E2AA|nr:hypothetical protein [Pseudothermotoga sp.]
MGGTAFNISERLLSKVEAQVKRHFYGFDVEVRRSTNDPDVMLTGAMEYLIENVLTNL